MELLFRGLNVIGLSRKRLINENTKRDHEWDSKRKFSSSYETVLQIGRFVIQFFAIPITDIFFSLFLAYFLH